MSWPKKGGNILKGALAKKGLTKFPNVKFEDPMKVGIKTNMMMSIYCFEDSRPFI